MFDFIRKKKDRSVLAKTIRTEDDAESFKQRFGLATHMSEKEMRRVADVPISPTTRHANFSEAPRRSSSSSMPKKHLGYHISHAQRPVSYHLPLHSEAHFNHEHAAADRRRQLSHSHKLARNLSFPGARSSRHVGSGEGADFIGNPQYSEDELHLLHTLREPAQVLNCVVAHSPLLVTPLEDHGERFLFAEVVDPSVEMTPTSDDDAHSPTVDVAASTQTHTSVEIMVTETKTKTFSTGPPPHSGSVNVMQVDISGGSASPREPHRILWAQS